MQRHTLTFRSKKKTKRTKILISYLVFVFLESKNTADFRNPRERSHFCTGIVAVLDWNSAYFEY